MAKAMKSQIRQLIQMFKMNQKKEKTQMSLSILIKAQMGRAQAKEIVEV